MCRLLAVKTTDPILLSSLITDPAHSIINQASNSRLRLDSNSINADGFGVGWYPTDGEKSTSCVFKSTTPAWSNQNLHRLAKNVMSPLVFAHVRASTTGTLIEDNCHPWTYSKLMWMHNGGVSNFSKVIRLLQRDLSDQFYSIVQGNTDSEWSFALFLECLSRYTQVEKNKIPTQYLRQAMEDTIAKLGDYVAQVKRTYPDQYVEEPSLLNFCVTDGHTILATRYASNNKPASLYYSTGTEFCQFAPHRFKMTKADKREDMVIIASEPLTFEEADWISVPVNTMICVTPRNNVLRFPIGHASSLRNTKYTLTRLDVESNGPVSVYHQQPHQQPITTL